MSESFKPPMRFPGINRSVSLFFLVAILLLMGISAVVSYKQGAFTPHTSIYFFAPDATGINKGMPVKIFGLPIGNVVQLDLSDQGIKVELSIASEYIRRIPRGSEAKVDREGVVGGAFLHIIPNTREKDMPAIKARETLEFRPSRSVAEMVDEFKNQLAPVLADMRGVLAALNNPDGDIRKSAAAARIALEQIPATLDSTHRLVVDADRAVNSFSPRADAAVSAFARAGTSADQQVPRLADKVATTLDTINDTAVQLRDIARKNGEALHETLRETPAVVRDSADLMRDSLEIADGVRNAWPVRNLVEPRATRTLPVDSYEAALQR